MIDCRFAELTARGRGAIGVIGVAGRDANRVLDGCFRSVAGRPLETDSRDIIYGVWLSTGEDLVIVRNPHAGLEVHCHGGLAATESVCQDLKSQSAVAIDAAEWQKTVHPVDPWMMATERALADCPTTRTAEIVLHQLRIGGKFFEEVETCLRTGNPGQRVDLRERLVAIRSWTDFGAALTRSQTIVLCGDPNVGKSSLINAICGFERSIVHATSGTTRDVLGQQTAIEGWPVELRDTAGLRVTAEPIERAGVERARTEIAAADCRVLVVAADRTDTSAVEQQAKELAADLVVINRIDLASGAEHELVAEPSNLPVVLTSALTGSGVDQLQKKIADVLVPRLPDADQIIPVAAEQINQLDAWLAALS